MVIRITRCCIRPKRALTTAYTTNLYWESRVKQNSIIAPLELNSQYNLSYLKSGGVWSRELFFKLVKKVKKDFELS